MCSEIDDDQHDRKHLLLETASSYLQKQHFCKRTGSARELAARIKSSAVQIGNVL
jgi:hypothetical protein